MYRGELLKETAPNEDIIKIIDAAIKALIVINEASTSYVVVNDDEIFA